MNWRKLCFELHGWVGLNLGLLLFVVCLSGTFATLSDEIDALLDPRHRIATHPGEGVEYDWSSVFETLESTFPDATVQSVSAPGSSARPSEQARTPALALVAMPTGQTRKVFVDPFTGELTGHTSFFNVERFFRTFHRRLFDGARGILIVTLTGIALLLSTVSGFAFYRGWLQQLRTLQLRGTRRRRWSDLHKVAGIWGLPFTLLIAVTGVYYLVEVAYTRAGAYDELLPPPMETVEAASLDRLGPQPELLPINEYVEIAEEAYPGLDVRLVRLPQSPDQPVYVDGRGGNPLTRDRADKVHIHPFTGQVIDVQRTVDLGVVAFMTDAVDPIHFGYFGGLGTQLLWFGLGLLLSFSILSGLYIWVVRSTSARKRPGLLMRGAPVAVAVTLGYLVLVGFGTADGIRGYALANDAPVTIGSTPVGPYDVRVDCEAPCRLSDGATVATRFLGSGLPNYALAEVVTPTGEASRLAGPHRRPRARVTVPDGESLTVRVSLRDGTIHEGSFVPLVPEIPRATRSEWPDTGAGVWWVVWGFLILTAGSILVWLALVARVGWARGAPREAPDRRASATGLSQ